MKLKIKKSDQVYIARGKDTGKTGRVIKVFPETDRLTVEGLNLFKKKVRPTRQGQKGETVSVPRPLHISNVMVVCPGCRKPARVGFRQEGEKKVRYCKKCEVSIS